MKNLLGSIISKSEHKDFKGLVFFMTNQHQNIYLRNGIIQLFREYCDQNRMTKKSKSNGIKRKKEFMMPGR